MRKYLIILLAALFIFGCSGSKPKKSKALARVNNYEIALDEFEEEFKESPYAANGTPQARTDFLNNLINRKLILQDAQAKGLDKEEGFLKMIEKFWEQSLLKLAIDKKIKETAGSVSVNDKEIQDAYNNIIKEGKVDKTYDQMYQQIKWEITRDKETQRINDWIAQLHNKADIKVNYDLLKQGK